MTPINLPSSTRFNSRLAVAMLVAVAMLTSVSASSLFAAEGDGHLDIYFIDVEGGACTLFVSPSGESLVIDSGYPEGHSSN